MKYLLIYDFTNTNEIINVFYFIVNNSKKELDKIKLNIKDDIDNLKNEHIINESLMEIIKNYLIVFEKIKNFSNDINYKDNFKKIINILKEGLTYKIDDLSYNDAFIRKLIINLFKFL